MRKLSSWLLGLALTIPISGTAQAHCQCRAFGQTFEQGQVVCLRLPDGSRLARCDKVLNNSSWKKIAEGCPEAGAHETPAAPIALASMQGN